MNIKAGRYARVNASFWTDEKVMRWPFELQHLALYLLTNQHRQLEGIYRLPLVYVTERLPWKPRTVKRWFSGAIAEGFILYDFATEVVVIRNSLKYQAPENPNVIAGALSRIRDLPKTELLKEYVALAKKHLLIEGATESAQTYCQELEQLVEHLLGTPVGDTCSELKPNLNLKPKLKAKSESESSHARPVADGDGNEGVLSHSSLDSDRKSLLAANKELEERRKVAGIAPVGSMLNDVLVKDKARK